MEICEIEMRHLEIKIRHLPVDRFSVMGVRVGVENFFVKSGRGKLFLVDR